MKFFRFDEEMISGNKIDSNEVPMSLSRTNLNTSDIGDENNSSIEFPTWADLVKKNSNLKFNEFFIRFRSNSLFQEILAVFQKDDVEKFEDVRFIATSPDQHKLHSIYMMIKRANPTGAAHILLLAPPNFRMRPNSTPHRPYALSDFHLLQEYEKNIDLEKKRRLEVTEKVRIEKEEARQKKIDQRNQEKLEKILLLETEKKKGRDIIMKKRADATHFIEMKKTLNKKIRSEKDAEKKLELRAELDELKQQEAEFKKKRQEAILQRKINRSSLANRTKSIAVETLRIVGSVDEPVKEAANVEDPVDAETDISDDELEEIHFDWF